MTTLEEIRRLAINSGLSKSQLQRISGLSFPAIDGILNGKDCRMSSYEALKNGLESAGLFKNRIGDIRGNSNVINQGNHNESISEKEKIELAELRVKVEFLERLLDEKEQLVTLYKQRVSDIESKDE